jgi:hypothetical protein
MTLPGNVLPLSIIYKIYLLSHNKSYYHPAAVS